MSIHREGVSGTNMSYWDSDYFRNRRRLDTTYDTVNSPFEKYLQDRQKIAVAVFGLDNSGITPPPPTHCDASIPLTWNEDRQRYLCKSCGEWLTKEQVYPPPKPKPQQSKIKAKQSNAQKTFIRQLPERKKKGGRLGNSDESSELSDNEYRWVSQMYGNIVEGSETEDIV